MTLKEAAQILELTPPFTKTNLKKAFRDALMVWHPDRFPEKTELRAKAESRTYQINEAYATLSRLSESDYPFRSPASSADSKTSATPPPSSSPPKTPSQTPPPDQQPKENKKSKTGLNVMAWLVGVFVLMLFSSLFNSRSRSSPKPQDRKQPVYAPPSALPVSPTPIAITNVPQASTISEAPMQSFKGNLAHASIEELIPLAEKGNLEAQFVLGHNYHNGIKVPKNETEAFKWFLRAAEQGDPASQGNVGTMFYDGNGVKKDGLAALTWWRKAAAQNEWLSQYNLGLAYHHGEDVPQDYSQAFQWYEKAATKGFAPAQFHLGLLYREGRGVAKDDFKAFNLFKDAAEQNCNAPLKVGQVPVMFRRLVDGVGCIG
jgi:hypothetical protein